LRLEKGTRIRVRAQIRYGRLSGNQTFTMTFRDDGMFGDAGLLHSNTPVRIGNLCVTKRRRSGWRRAASMAESVRVGDVRIAEPYFVPADATILPSEYLEKLKLNRCRIRGVRCCIMRPEPHETVPEAEAEKRLDALTRLEIMSDRYLRTALNLNNGDTVEVEIDGDENWWNAS
jgi:hypothetical protein